MIYQKISVPIFIAILFLGITVSYAQISPKLNQILIGNLIKDTSFTGLSTDPEYTAEYNVRNLFDNITNTFNFWSQKGPSTINVMLGEPLKDPVCKIEFKVYNPANQKYHLKIIDSTGKTVLDHNGVFEVSKEILDIKDCVKDIKSFNLAFTPAATTGKESYTVLSDMNFFTNSTVILKEVCDDGIDNDGDGLIDRQDVKDCPPGPMPGNNGTLNIVNGTAIINALNSDFRVFINTTDTEDNKTEVRMLDISQDDDDEEDDDN